MRGRSLFSAARPALAAGELLARALPVRAAGLFMEGTRHVPTVIGLGLRYVLLQRLAERCGECVAVFEGAYIRAPDRLTIGSNVSIHPMCYLDASGGLSIGSDVSIGHGATIMSSSHVHATLDHRSRDRGELRPTRIGDDVLIGAGARILGGVTIGDHAVVGAQAVVTRSVAPGAVVAGVPARVIGQRR